VLSDTTYGDRQLIIQAAKSINIIGDWYACKHASDTSGIILPNGQVWNSLEQSADAFDLQLAHRIQLTFTGTSVDAAIKGIRLSTSDTSDQGIRRIITEVAAVSYTQLRIVQDW
jgi:hypothetical protein